MVDLVNSFDGFPSKGDAWQPFREDLPQVSPMKLHLWLIPPLLGIAAYFAAGAGVGARSSRGSGPEEGKLVHESPKRSDVAAALGEFEQEWQALKKETSTEDTRLTVTALRDKIVALKKALEALPDDTDWSTIEDFRERLSAAARELGKREGSKALAWAETIDPELRLDVMSGWAEADPDAAFEAVVACKRLGPCHGGTLTTLLLGKAAAGNAALAEACRQVPWELFLDMPGDPFREGPLHLPKEADIKPWIESGAARELAEEGMSIPYLFDRWAQMDAPQALEAALGWPRTSEAGIMQVLGVGTKNEAKRDEIRSFLETLPPERFAEVSAAVTKYCERPSLFGERLASAYPALISRDDGKETE